MPRGAYGGRGASRAWFMEAAGRSSRSTVDPKGFSQILHSESGHNAIFTLEVRGKAPARAMIRDWQSEPVAADLLHVDLVRIARDTKLKLQVAIQVTGEPEGVKVEGGIFEFVLREVEVECLPDDIPERFIVDVSGSSWARTCAFRICRWIRRSRFSPTRRAWWLMWSS